MSSKQEKKPMHSEQSSELSLKILCKFCLIIKLIKKAIKSIYFNTDLYFELTKAHTTH